MPVTVKRSRYRSAVMEALDALEGRKKPGPARKDPLVVKPAVKKSKKGKAQ